jgi:predicted nucleic acid-binding protein
MELGYLLDTNAAIDYLGNKLPGAGSLFLDNLVPAISVMTRIEILGWFQINAKQLLSLSDFIDNSIIYALDERIILKTIELRQELRIKTPDAIIAATAIINNQILITRNTKDFTSVTGLEVLNPYEI